MPIGKTVFISALLYAASGGAVTIDSYGWFNIYHYDVGEVWNGSTNSMAWSTEQLEDVHAAIDEWDRVINNVPVRQINLHLIWSNLGQNESGYTILGSSSSYNLYTDSYSDGRPVYLTGSEVAWRESVDISNPWDSYILYNDSFPMSFGVDAPATGTIDFRSLITHELGHSLGWQSFYNSSTDTFYDGLTVFQRFLVDSEGNSPFENSAGTPGDFNELDAPIYFNGYNATNLYGGLVPIYAPESYSPGSSMSHLDEATFGTALMTPSIGTAELGRTVSDLEIAMMADMGWDVIPEPSTVVLLALVGVGSVAVRRIFMM